MSELEVSQSLSSVRQMSLPSVDVPEARLPILGPLDWLKHVDTDETGTLLPNPFDGFLPPVVTGRFTIVGADTEVGKSVLLMQHYRHVLDFGITAAYLTLEMNPKDLFERLANQFDGGEEEARAWVVEREAYISESFITMQEIETVLRSDQFEFVAIDHLHEIPYRDRQELETNLDRLAGLAVSHNVALLAAAQMRRPDPQFPRPPSKHDFKDSGKFEQVADLAFAIEQEDEHLDERRIWTLKNRYGSKPAPIDVRLDRTTVTFKRA